MLYPACLRMSPAVVRSEWLTPPPPAMLFARIDGIEVDAAWIAPDVRRAARGVLAGKLLGGQGLGADCVVSDDGAGANVVGE